MLLEYGAPRQAADVFREILRTNNRDAQTWASEGVSELAQEDYQAARTAFRNAARFDPSDERSRSQLGLVERILALDPNAPGLRASARYQRSVEILTGTLQMAEQCPAASHDPAVDAARKKLALRARREDIDNAVDMNLDLAVTLWKSATNLCPSQQQRDEALDRALARLSRQ